MNGITKQTFQDADEKTRFGILFDYQFTTAQDIKEIKELMQKHPHGCEERFQNLENRKFKNIVFSGCMGFLGGFSAMVSAMVAKLKFWS